MFKKLDVWLEKRKALNIRGGVTKLYFCYVEEGLILNLNQ